MDNFYLNNDKLNKKDESKCNDNFLCNIFDNKIVLIIVVVVIFLVFCCNKNTDKKHTCEQGW